MTSNMRTKGIRLAVAVLGAVILVSYQNCSKIKFGEIVNSSVGTNSVLDFDLVVPVSGATNESLHFEATNIHFNSGDHNPAASETVTWTAVGVSPVVANPSQMSFSSPGNYIVNVTVEKDGEATEKQFSLQIVDGASQCSYSELSNSNFVCDEMASGNLQVISHAHCYVRINELANLLPHPVYTFVYSVEYERADVLVHEEPLAQNADHSIDYDLAFRSLYAFSVRVQKDSCPNTVNLHHDINLASTGTYEWRCTCTSGDGLSKLCYDSSTNIKVNNSFCENEAQPVECTQQICNPLD